MIRSIYIDSTTRQPHIATIQADYIPLNDGRKRDSDTIDGSIISFHNLSYKIDTRRSFGRLPLPFVAKEKKKILHNLTGLFQPGINAILGPTGSGKSSLLDILADRKSHRGITGHVMIDGQERTSGYKHRVGYVAQDDVVSGTLSVRENLTFSANIRLPDSISREEKIAIVNHVIEQLGLMKCADSKVGDEYQRGISGGERRRTNIGLELVLSPRVLFLDEPTTGLDSATARNVIKYLYRLSRNNHTIILSIHQPQYSIFKLFDRIFLLAAGHCTYHGSMNEILPYFNTIGYHCEEHDNPADFILDVCQGDVPCDQFGNRTARQSLTDQQQIISHLNTSFVNSTVFTPIENFVREQLEKLNSEQRSEVTIVSKSFKTEFYYVAQRTLRTTFRNPALLVMQIAVPMFLALLIGMIFYHVDRSSDQGKQNRLGAIYFIVANQIFGNLSALEIFLKERVLFIHENSSGYYRISTYFLSKLFCDLIPMRMIPAILFSLIAYFMIGLQTIAAKFFLFCLGIFMIVICASSLCFLVSASVRLFSIGNLLAAAFCTLASLFTGLFIDLSSVTPVLSWIQWISIFRYSYNFLVINEFKDLTLSISGNAPYNITGESVLSVEKIDHQTRWDFWKNFLALILMTIVFLVLSFIQLIRMKKTR